MGRTNRLIVIMKPDHCNHEHGLARAIETREERYRRIIEDDPNDKMPEKYMMTVLECVLTVGMKHISHQSTISSLHMRHVVER